MWYVQDCEEYMVNQDINVQLCIRNDGNVLAVSDEAKTSA